MIPPGTRLGPYEILGPLGAGGMGEVYRARDTRLERDVAVKILPAAFTDSPVARERFLREARAVAALQHPNICTIFDVGEISQGQTYLVMELLQGETMQQRLTRGAFDAVLLVDTAMALADALDAAHGAGIIHRDIKPANIQLTARGPKILDFGLAKQGVGGAGGEDLSALQTRPALLTDPGSTVGTVVYMSPEQLRGEALDARTDLFSLGLVLYEMATGRAAFPGATSAMISAAILHQPPAAPRQVRPEVSPRFEDVVLKAIEKDRGLRYQHASEMRTDIQRLKRDSSSTPAATADAPAARPRLTMRRGAIAAATVVLALVAACYAYRLRAEKLTDKDTIVLADFTNTTGDPVFDGTLRRGLAIQLGQSPFLSLVSEERIQGVLSLMGQPPNAPLTPAVARDVCQRTSSAAVLEGSIATLGSQYVLGLRATNCRTGEVLDEQQVQAARKEDVLNALSQIAIAFRTRVGESLATVKQHDTPLEEATTPSLEALKAFSAGSRILAAGNDLPAAVPLFKRAVEIDPKFAMAYASLGMAYFFSGEPDRSAESAKKAYELRDRISDREKFFIAASYELQVTGNLEQARQTCELWIRTYPRERVPYGFLGALVYPTFGRYDQGVEAARKMIDIDPEFPIGYLQLAFNLQFRGDLEEADKALQRAFDRKLENTEFFPTLFDIAFLKRDIAGMERIAALTHGKTGAEDSVTQRQGFVFAYSGRLTEARVKSRQAVDLARQAKQPARAAFFVAGAALWDAFFGNESAARQGAAAALALSTDRDLEYGASFALALAGDSSASQTLADNLEMRFPEDTEVRFTYLPAIRAVLAINHHEAARAIELLQVSAPYDLGTPLSSAAPCFAGILYTVYARGLAYLAAHRAPRPPRSFRRFSITARLSSAIRLARWRAFSWAGHSSCRERRPRRRRPTRTSSRSGKMPTRMSRCTGKPRPSTRRFGKCRGDGGCAIAAKIIPRRYRRNRRARRDR